MSALAQPARFISGPGPVKTMRALLAGRFLAMPQFLTACSREYGPISKFNLLGTPAYFIDDADGIAELLVAKGRSFKKGRGLERIRILLGDGLLTSEEPLHLQRRRIVQPAFHRERIDEYARTMIDSTLRAIEPWRDGETRDVSHDMGLLTLEIASKALFGADVSSDSAEIASALSELLALFPALMSPLGPLRSRMPLPSTRRFEAAKAKLDRAVERIIAQHRSDSSTGRTDVLSLMMASRLDNGEALDERALRDESLTFLLAGHETTANALAWTLYLLATHPDAAQRARDEARSVPAEQLDGGALEALPFITACFKEAMRLFPPAWIVGRRAIEDVRILDAEIPKGTIVFSSPYVTHRNPRYYPDPQTFRPDRWLDGESVPRFAYFPFGGGNRVCIGEPFAWLEGAIVLALLLSRYSFTPTPQTSDEIQPIVTLRPRYGMPLHVRRTSSIAV
jgi:cytochrome P450